MAKTTKTTATKQTTTSKASRKAAGATTKARAGQLGTKGAAKALRADKRLPAAGTVLRKVARNGRSAECTIEAAGVRYNGRIYRSLSGAAVAAAKKLRLTSTNLNGFAFWGLGRAKKTEAQLLAELNRSFGRYCTKARGLLELYGHREQSTTAVEQHAVQLGLALLGKAA